MRSRQSPLASVILLMLPVLASSINAAPLPPEPQQATEPVIDIPKVDSIQIDGKLDDWADRGFVIPGMGMAKAVPWLRNVTAPSCKIGWNQDGIIVGIQVTTSTLHEHDYVRHLFKGDSVEFFVSPQKGSRERYMLVMSPGLDPRFPAIRSCFFPDPSEEGEKDMDGYSFQAGRQATKNGYTLEVLLPWKNLEIAPRIGRELALQIYVMETDETGKCHTAMWHPAGESHLDPSAVFRIRLAQKPTPSFSVIATMQDDSMRNTRPLRILGNAALADQKVEIRLDAGTILGAMAARGDQSYAMFDLPQGQTPSIFIDQKPVPVILLPPENDVETVLSEKLKCTFKSHLFTGEQFPNPMLEGARGYKINHTTYYNVDFQPVSKAITPGRYGAVIEIADRKGKTTNRFRTLVRVPKNAGAESSDADQLRLITRQLAIDPEYASLLNPPGQPGVDTFTWLFDDLAANRADTAILLAYCMEKFPLDIGNALTNAQSADRQWWLQFKRKWYGWDKIYTQPFVCPRPIAGSPAATLREGTCKEAGINPGVIADIDAVCTQTAQFNNEPVGILFARHGVIFFQKAYGNLPSGEPMTLQTPGDMQSSTKPLGAALMMMLADQGLVNVNDPIDKYLPPFRGITVKRPILLYQLYTHTSGLNGHWGDSFHDTEEIVSGYYHTLQVGHYGYNSLGFALGGKIMESITGESLPLYAKKHLLDPLGMRHSEVTCAAKLAKSIPSEYARFAQMLLNRGAYGNQRFFSEKTFEKMISATLTGNRGMGVIWYGGNQLDNAVIGHNAGNSSMIRIDFANDMLFVACSAGTQKDFRSCYAAIIKTVQDGITDK